MRRKVIRAGVVTTATIALVLTGCGGPSGGAGSQTDSGKVLFWDTSGPNESPVFARIAQGCAQQGGYQVQVERVAFDQARSNFKTAAQGGQGPDVLRTEVAWVAEFAKNGLLEDLSGTEVASDTADFRPLPVESTKFEGKTYGVPQVVDAMGLYYNRAMLAAAGVSPPRSYDELLAAAPKLGGDKAFFLNNGSYYALPFIYGAGGDVVDANAKKIVINSPQAVQGLQTAKGLLDAKAARTALDRTNSYQNMQAAFASGEVAMVVNGPWSYQDYLKGAAFTDPANLGVAAIPGPTAGAGKSPIGGHDYTVRKGTAAKASSIKLIQCMASADSQATISKELGLLPTRKSVLERPEVKANPAVAAFGPILDTAHGRPWIPELPTLFDPLNVTYADVLSGAKDPKTALDELAKTYQTQLPGYTVG